MEVTEARKQADQLKLELWQSLPDFYRGHRNPMPQPLSYNPDRPYPYNYLAKTIFEAPRPTPPSFPFTEGMELLYPYLPSETSTEATSILVTPCKKYFGAVLTAGTGASTSIPLDTVFFPQYEILDFVAQIISNQDLADMEVDPEGPYQYFLTRAVAKHELVGLAIGTEFEVESGRDIFSGVFDRRQLAQELLKICEDKENYFYDIGPEEEAEIGFRLKRLKAII